MTVPHARTIASSDVSTRRPNVTIAAIIERLQSTGAEYDTGEVVGRDAEVVTPIPAGGTGEVAYLARGQRELSAARTIDGTAVPRGRPVVIERVVGQTLYVRPRE